jgi:hypothetical protein
MVFLKHLLPFYEEKWFCNALKILSDVLAYAPSTLLSKHVFATVLHFFLSNISERISCYNCYTQFFLNTFDLDIKHCLF